MINILVGLMFRMEMRTQKIFIFVWPPRTFGFSATAYASEELASLYDQEKDQRYLLYFTKYLGGIDLDYPLWAPYIYANMAMSTPEMYLIAAECEGSYR